MYQKYIIFIIKRIFDFIFFIVNKFRRNRCLKNNKCSYWAMSHGGEFLFNFCLKFIYECTAVTVIHLAIVICVFIEVCFVFSFQRCSIWIFNQLKTLCTHYFFKDVLPLSSEYRSRIPFENICNSSQNNSTYQ